MTCRIKIFDMCATLHWNLISSRETRNKNALRTLSPANVRKVGLCSASLQCNRRGKSSANILSRIFWLKSYRSANNHRAPLPRGRQQWAPVEPIFSIKYHIWWMNFFSHLADKFIRLWTPRSYFLHENKHFLDESRHVKQPSHILFQKSRWNLCVPATYTACTPCSGRTVPKFFLASRRRVCRTDLTMCMTRRYPVLCSS